MKFFRRRLKNGIRLIGEIRDLPVVSLSITNEFGAAHETADIKGIAHFMEHLVFTGTKTRTHEDISREIEKKGGVLNAFTSDTVTSFWFKLPSEHVITGLDILTDMLVNPTFKEEKFEKEKKVVIEEIKMYHDSPQYHVYEKINENLYEKPFGVGVIGTKDSVGSLKRDFVADYFNKKYASENYIVTFVGKVDPEIIANYLEKKFIKKEAKLKIIPIKERNTKTTEERPGLDQAHYIFGMHAPRINDRKRFAFEIMDAFLANGMSSHLFLKIREERGLAYSVKSTIDSKKEYGNYTIYVGTKKEAIPEVEKLILNGFSKVKEISTKEFNEAKERLIGLKRISKEESVEVMNELMFAEISNKAEDFYKYEEEIKKIKIDEVKELGKTPKYSSSSIVPK